MTKRIFVTAIAAAVIAASLPTAGATNALTAVPTSAKGQAVYVGSTRVYPTGYNINDNNYFKLRDLAGKTHALFDELLHLRSASSDRLSRQSGASGFVDRFKICILKCLGKSSALLCDLGVQIRRGFSERFGTGSAFPFVCLRL